MTETKTHLLAIFESRRIGYAPRMPDERPDAPVPFEHPRGTIAIVYIFGVLFALGWLAMYVLRYLGIGATTH